MVFQSHALFPHKTVAQNIEFGLRMKKVPRDERARRVREVAEMVRLTALLGKLPGACSGGEAQRVALARTLVTNPSTFLLDEPLSSLDAKLRRELRAECDRLHQELKKTFIFVTHDQEEAMTLADRIVVMRAGDIEQVGSPMEIYSNPASEFVADFFGSPSMNLVAGEITAMAARRFRSRRSRSICRNGSMRYRPARYAGDPARKCACSGPALRHRYRSSRPPRRAAREGHAALLRYRDRAPVHRGQQRPCMAEMEAGDQVGLTSDARMPLSVRSRRPGGSPALQGAPRAAELAGVGVEMRPQCTDVAARTPDRDGLRSPAERRLSDGFAGAAGRYRARQEWPRDRPDRRDFTKSPLGASRRDGLCDLDQRGVPDRQYRDGENEGLRATGTTHENGTVFRILELQPGNIPRVHRTNSLDYAVIMKGEIDMELETGEITHLKAGDVVVQRGTVHNWINNGTEPCVIAFVLIAAKPVEIGGKVLNAFG